MKKVDYLCNQICSPYHIVMDSIIGDREEQQDAIYAQASDREMLLVLCDGMGGFEGGGIASKMAVSEFQRLYAEENVSNVKEFLLCAMDFVDGRIARLRNHNNEKIRAGSTCVCLVASGDHLYWLSVGDSRLYIIRNGRMRQITRDHTVGLKAELDYYEGRIDSEEFQRAMDDKEVLCSYLGMDGIGIYDLSEKALKLEPGDIMVMASDGLYKSVSDQRIQAIINENDNVETALSAVLIEATKRAKGRNQDNTSVIICKYK